MSAISSTRKSRRRYVLRRTRKESPLRKYLRNNRHDYEFKFLHEEIIYSSGGVYTDAYEFTLSQIPNYTELSALYDQYKIMKIHVTFRPRYNVNSASVAATGIALPYLHWVVDHDDATTPSTTVNTFLENSRVKSVVLDRPRTVTLEPHILTEIYKTSVTTGYGNKPCRKQWIDMSDTSLQMFGLKFFIECPNMTLNDHICDVYYKYEVQCLGCR